MLAINAFKHLILPKIDNYKVDYQDTEVALHQVRNAKVCFTMYEIMDGEYKFLFSDFGENEFEMLLILFDKNPQLREFIRGAIVNTELYRIGEEKGIMYSNTLLRTIKKWNS